MTINLWKYIKAFPYWEYHKMQFWYYFHPVSHFKEMKDDLKYDNIHKRIEIFKERRNEKCNNKSNGL